MKLFITVTVTVNGFDLFQLTVILVTVTINLNHTDCHRVNTPRKQGGLGEMRIPLLADKTGKISQDYGVLKEENGIAFR